VRPDIGLDIGLGAIFDTTFRGSIHWTIRRTRFHGAAQGRNLGIEYRDKGRNKEGLPLRAALPLSSRGPAGACNASLAAKP
jgi:hypothetical protein